MPQPSPKGFPGPETVAEVRVEARPRCALCQTEGRLLFGDLTDAQYSTAGSWSMFQCPRCRLAWLNPMPLSAQSETLYRDYHTHLDPSALGRWIQRAAIEFFAGVALPPSVPVKGFLRRLGRASRRSGWAAKTAYGKTLGVTPTRSGRLLDIGCGSGAYLQLMKALGWETVGIDFDATAVQGARQSGLEVHQGEVGSVSFTANAFDVITLSHVIEHLSDPRMVLTRCREWLRPQGEIVLATPNLGSYGRHHFGRDWRGLEPPRHCYVFTPANLSALLRECGFEIVDCTTSARWAWTLTAQSLAKRLGQQGRWPLTPLLPYLLAVGFYHHLREAEQVRKAPVGEEIWIRARKS